MENTTNKPLIIVAEGFDDRINLKAITNYSYKFMPLYDQRNMHKTTSEDYKICEMHRCVLKRLLFYKIPFVIISNKNNKSITKTIFQYGLNPDYYVRQTRLQELRDNNIPVFEINIGLEEFLNKESNYKYLYDKISSLELYKFDLGLI